MNIYKTIKAARESYIDTLGKLYEYSTASFAKRPFLNLIDSEEQHYTYGSFKKQCDSLSKKLSQYGIGAGDRVAVFSQSMPNWGVAMFSIVPFGRVFVPILPDCSESEVTNILTHSESKAIFVSKRCMPRLSQECIDRLTLVIDIETLEPVKVYDEAMTFDGKVVQPMPDDIAAIIYTSGTTGSAKGVVLSQRNFASNAKASYRCHHCNEHDVWLSILPMAHTYELSIGFLYPMYVGGSVYYLPKSPVASVLIAAMQKVKPSVVLSVPLIIEKVYKSSVVPTIEKSKMLSWMNVHMHKTMCRIICKKLVQTFGGRLNFFGIGGSKLDPVVEQFLFDGGFPYSIGYGTTECAPLVCSACDKKRFPGSIGEAVYAMEAKLYDVNPETGEGEIVTRGDAVMFGYYKDPARTKAAFTPDGWYRTNDLAIQDKKGRFFIRGRLNNLILGPSGENIYPEEIEHVIAEVAGVNESIVMEREGKLIALVNIDDKLIDWNQEGEDKFFDNVESLRASIKAYVNKRVGKNSKVSDVEVMKEPFEKTATQKIRRFKYKDAKGVSRENNSTENKTDNK